MKNHLDDLGKRVREAPSGRPPTREWLERRRSERRRHRWLATGTGAVLLGLAATALLAGVGGDPNRTEAVDSAPETTVVSSTTTEAGPTGEPLQSAEAAPLEDRLADLEAELRAWAVESETPGFSMAAVDSEGIVHQATFGFADRDREIPVSANTLFHVAAMQTSMNALLIATLVEDGVVGWDSPVAELVPEAGIDPDITMRHLLTMTAGIAFDAERQLPTGEITSDEVGPLVFAATAREENRPAEPGAKFFYNSVSHAAAGYLAAGAAAEDNENVHEAYLRLFTERVLEPLGMNDSTLVASEALATGNLARSYSIVGRELPNTDKDVDILAPAGSLKSTAGDMGLYLRTLLNSGVTPSGETIVSPDSLAVLSEPLIDDYAMGWFHSVSDNGVTFLAHGGFFKGFVGYMFLAPEADLGVVVLTNSESAEPGLFGPLADFADTVRIP